MKRYICGEISKNGADNLYRKIVIFNHYWLNNLEKLAQAEPIAIISEYRYVFSHVPSYLQKYNIPIFFFDIEEISRLNTATTIAIDIVKNSISIYHDDSDVVDMEHLVNRNNKPIIVNTSIKGLDNRMSFECGADGVGLISTEFLFFDYCNMDGTLYYEVLDSVMSAHPKVKYTIRLFDFNYDKFPKWFSNKYYIDSYKYYKGRNFFFVDAMNDLLIMQLSMIVKLSSQYKISILLPYINSVNEVLKIQKMLETLDINRRIRLGTMLETVSAIHEIDNLKPYVNFFSIGTNDLVQSYFGIDRTDIINMNEINIQLSLFSNLLRLAFEKAADKKIKVCGQLPIVHGMLEQLIQIGYTEFTVSPQWVPYIKSELNLMKL